MGKLKIIYRNLPLKKALNITIVCFLFIAFLGAMTILLATRSSYYALVAENSENPALHWHDFFTISTVGVYVCAVIVALQYMHMIKPSGFCLLAAGCPGFKPDVRASRRISDLLAGYPGLAIQRALLCCAARRMSGPSCYAGCPGLTPGCPAPLFPALFLPCSSSGLPGRMSGP